MKQYRAAVIGCSRIGGFIDNESVGPRLPGSHAAAYEAHDRVDIVACSDLREDVMEKFGERYGVPKERQYTDYKAMVAQEGLDIVSVATQPEPRAEITVWLANNGIKGDLRREGHGGLHGRGRRDGRGVRGERRPVQPRHQQALEPQV